MDFINRGIASCFLGAFFLVVSLLAAGPVTAQTFKGKHAEVRLGLDLLGADLWEELKIDDGYYRMAGSRRLKLADGGFNYGAGLGYDFALSERVVAGVEATIDFSTAKNCLYGFYLWNDLCLKAGRDIGVGVRAGVIIVPRVLLFAKLGYANGRVKVTGWDAMQGRSYSQAKTRGGTRYGGGLEVPVSDLIFLKAEYTYTDYSKWDAHFKDGNIYIHDARLGFDRHKTLLSVGARF